VWSDLGRWSTSEVVLIKLKWMNDTRSGRDGRLSGMVEVRRKCFCLPGRRVLEVNVDRSRCQRNIVEEERHI